MTEPVNPDEKPQDHREDAELAIERLTPHNPIMKYFRFAHLRIELQLRSRPWAELAVHVCDTIPQNAERTVALRKLLEGKDAAVRAALP